MGGGGVTHSGISEAKGGGLKHGSRPWLGIIWIFSGIAQYIISPKSICPDV